jgi:hypothetical protein
MNIPQRKDNVNDDDAARERDQRTLIRLEELIRAELAELASLRETTRSLQASAAARSQIADPAFLVGLVLGLPVWLVVLRACWGAL